MMRLCAVLTMAAEQVLAAGAYETPSRTCSAPASPGKLRVEGTAGSSQAPLHAICAREVPVLWAIAVRFCAYCWASSVGVVRWMARFPEAYLQRPKGARTTAALLPF
ncbi:hypothetical protein C7974DRAFT_392316 [Boeremia exigua]|uniref:uncharacterized protein n=1 Tax=Boeremia exigua TaxID=749465 RepID=UPI001E8D0D24|nr:uncharacterized protein C7974DRAFT_392316 [Boeremia exigua]KAH6633182.1 hypothetical protein C7974DRAFT_392316 [Boeremia exigua]